MNINSLPTNDKANPQARGRSRVTTTTRKRREGEALPQLKAAWDMNPGQYRPGDGDHFHQTTRPGADDHMQYKSRSFS